MVVLQGQGSAQMERLVYGDSEQLIREYMLRNGQRLLDFFKRLPGLDFSREIAASAFGQAVRELPGLEAATQDEVEATWKRLCSHSGVKSRLTESGLREHLRKTGKRVVELFEDLDIEARREEGRGLSRDDFGRAVRMLGSAALMLAWVACGRLSAYFEADLNAWDSAAGVLLVREAGGVVTQLDGSPFTLASRPLLASNAAAHAALRDTLVDAGVLGLDELPTEPGDDDESE